MNLGTLTDALGSFPLATGRYHPAADCPTSPPAFGVCLGLVPGEGP